MSKKPRILIADDDFGPRESLRFLFKDDYHLLFAENGIQALELFKNQSPDLILMDIRMPKMDGWEAIRQIRGQGNLGPIIVITCIPDPSDQIRARELGVIDYIAKPFDLFHIQKLVREQLTSSIHLNSTS